MRISKNALTGNAEVLNEFEGDGVIDKVIRPEREGLQSSFESQEWLFTDSIMSDISREEAEGEAFISAIELKNASFARRLEVGFEFLRDDDLSSETFQLSDEY